MSPTKKTFPEENHRQLWQVGTGVCDLGDGSSMSIPFLKKFFVLSLTVIDSSQVRVAVLHLFKYREGRPRTSRGDVEPSLGP